MGNLKIQSERFIFVSSGPSGSAQNHGHINRTFTAEIVDLSVAATLVDEQSQDTVRC